LSGVFREKRLNLTPFGGEICIGPFSLRACAIRLDDCPFDLDVCLIPNVGLFPGSGLISGVTFILDGDLGPCVC
jgi:hypothetical protein